jgi:hypothetical protein
MVKKDENSDEVKQRTIKSDQRKVVLTGKVFEFGLNGEFPQVARAVVWALREMITKWLFWGFCVRGKLASLSRH